MKSSIVSGENRGSVNNILLKALQSGDKYGYEINKEIETKSNGKYFLKEASLYSGLKRLQASGHITSYWKDGELGIRRHYYSITNKGLAKLQNSNFSWDSSKDFIDDIFSNPKETVVKSNLNEQQLNSQTQTTSENTVLKSQENNVNNNISPSNAYNDTKKNPFAYEVSPMQQSLFDSSLFNTSSSDISNSNTNNINSNENNDEIKTPSLLDETTKQNDVETTNTNTNNNNNNNNIVENISEAENSSISLIENTSLNSSFIENENKILEEEKPSNENEKDSVENSIDKSVETKQETSENTNKSQYIENLEKPLYDELINSYSQNSYSSNLNKETKCLDILSLFDNKKENTESIVFVKPKQNLEQKIEEKPTCNTESINNLNLNNNNATNFEKYTEKNSYVENLSNSFTNPNNILKSDEGNIATESPNKENLNLENIFGNLLADSPTNINQNLKNDVEIPFTKEDIEKELPLEEKLEKPKKQELPRYDVSNNVNITLNSPPKPKKEQFYNTYFNPDMNIPSGTNNIPSVKQYIDTLHRKNVISNATKVDDEVNLEGIKVREYEKMNNRLIKNSNYVYINKLNAFLAFILASLLIVESVLSITLLSVNGKIKVFEIVIYSLIILASLIYVIIMQKIYQEDKFKVILKNFNLKTNLFYTILIFVVCLVFLVCANILLGMTSYNFSDFVLKLLLEVLVCLNIVLFPIIKYFCFKLKRFSN